MQGVVIKYETKHIFLNDLFNNLHGTTIIHDASEVIFFVTTLPLISLKTP